MANRFTSLGDSKLEFMAFDDKPPYNTPDIKFISSKFRFSTKKSILIVGAILFIIFLLALTAALARSSCRYSRDIKPGSLVASQEPTPEGYGDLGNDLFPGYLLPKSIKPIRYEITITPDWNRAGFKTIRVPTFRGKVKIVFTALKSVSHLILNNKDLRFTSVTLRLSDQVLARNDHALTDIIYDDKRYEMVRINLTKKLAIDETYILEIEYTGNISRTTNGFYSSTYTTSSNGQRIYLLSTQFEPNYARRAFPSLDEPEYKAKFTIEIDRPGTDDMLSLSNMPLETSQPITDPITNIQLVRDKFKESVAMSTYLVAFVICDFKSIHTNSKSNIKVGVYAPPDQIDQASFALQVAVSGLNFYEDFFKIKFPLPKIDLIGIPDFSVGAMENWGLITYRMVELLFKENISSTQIKERVTIVITHELAHQWFGNLVTMYWWDDIWLNEGFATYMEYVCADAIFPDWGMARSYWPDTAPNAYFLDAFEGSHPVSHSKVLTPGDMQSMFDAISYNKGSLLIGMLNGHIMPHDKFKKGLTNYLNKHVYNNARSSDLWAALQEEIGPPPFESGQISPLRRPNRELLAVDDVEDNSIVFAKQVGIKRTEPVNIKDVMDGWVKQKGFPVVHIMDPTRDDVDNGKGDYVVDLYQSKFRSQYNTHLPRGLVSDDSMWQIPLTLLIGRVGWPRQKCIETLVWLKGGNLSHSISGYFDGEGIDDIWMKGNLNFSGYYVVKYGPKLWENLKAQLNSDVSALTTLDRSQLIKNVFLLARFGYMDFVEALNFSTYANPEAFQQPNDKAGIDSGLNENDAMTLAVLIGDLASFRNYFRFRREDDLFENLVPAFIRKLLLNHLLTHFNEWKSSKELTHQEINLQSYVIGLAINFGDKATIEKARSYFNPWIHDYSPGKTYLPYPELAAAILTAGIRYGNSSDWDAAWEAYKKSNVPSEKSVILQALTTTQDRLVLDKLMSFVYNGLNSGHPTDENYIRNQDIASILSLIVSSSPVSGARTLAWEFIKNNWDLILKTFGDSTSTLANIVRSVCKAFDSSVLRNDYDLFSEKALKTSGIPAESLSQVREIIDLNVAFLDKNSKPIATWLKNHI